MSDDARAAPGSPAARRIGLALFLAGFATFSLLYCVQPLLPLFAADFRLSPAASALALSASTGTLAVAIMAAGALSERMDRRRLMFASMTVAALLNLAGAAMPRWPGLLATRALEGFALGGVPAVAMAYLADTMAPEGLGRAMGRYVGGTAFGGMAGRVMVGALAEHLGWRAAVATMSVLDLAAAAAFVALLPGRAPGAADAGSAPGRAGGGMDARAHLAAWRSHLARREMRALFGIAFLAMGVFVTVYNYAGFRLMQPPFSLGQTAIGLLFCAYVFGIVSSNVGGAMADRLGRGPVLLGGLAIAGAGVLLTMPARLPLVVLGLVGLTIGFFVAHSVASAWVGRLAGRHAGHAASLYLLAYYLGSSVLGAAGGGFWSRGGWPAVGAFALAGLAGAGALARGLRGAEPARAAGAATPVRRS